VTKLALTPERRRTIEEARDEWLRIGLSTDPADFGAAEAAITTLYESIGKKRPYFVKLSSPLAAELYINLYCATWPAAAGPGGQKSKSHTGGQLRDQLWDQLGDQLWDQLRDQLGDQLWGQLRDQLGDQLWGQLGDQLWDQLWDQLRGQLWDQLRGQLRDQLRDQLGDQLWDQLWDQLRDQLGDQLWDQLGGQLGDQLGDQLWGQLWDQLRDQLGDQLRGQLWESRLRFTWTWFYGAWDYLWQWYDGGRRVGMVLPEKLNQQLDAHLTVCRSIGLWYPFDDFVILTDRPDTIRRDTRNRLHCDDGPALRYRDGYSLYFLNGLPVTRQIVEAPETLTAHQVRDETNAEIRRHMLDRYAGLRGSAAAGKWLADIGAKPISSVDITAKMQPSGLAIWKLQNGDAPVLCKLYRADMPDDEPLVLLFVVCTSTAKEVFLRVPPDFTDAARARDWTFGESLAEAVET
jgi:hypothetical protein